MKDNVDLTEHQDFSRQPVIRFIPVHSDPSFHDTGLILTGNARIRKAKRLEMDFCVTNHHCDRCSDTIPWHFLMGSCLCDKCEVELEEEVNQDKPRWFK